VSHLQVVTRIATAEDLPVLLSLWDELRQVGGRAERAINPMSSVDIAERLAEVVDDISCRVVLAEVAGTPAGMTLLQVSRPDPLSDNELVTISHLVVSRAKRQHGVGHALITAASDFAIERHVDHVIASVYPSLRDANRFFARLGFAPVAAQRVVPVAALRRRLEADRGMPGLADVVRRRTRIGRPIPPQRARRVAKERIES
jgi:GNAT superfamily N-acetyltransferase